MNKPEDLNRVIDLHGQTQDSATGILRDRISSTCADLDSGKLTSNISPNSPYHILKVICGAGTHSKTGKGVLKIIIDKWLKSSKFDYFAQIERGVFLVKLCKR